jgi:lipopolysaccharide transport system permease protein
MLPALIPVLLLLWVFACAVALFVSALQVFIKDTAQILPPLMTFWFFTTPILYSPSLLPERVAKVFAWNPMAGFVSQLREIVLYGRVSFGKEELLAVVIVIVFSWLALRFFRRFSGHFEDFL